MYYTIEGHDFYGALITADGVVQHATREFEWACGEPIGMVLGFFDRQRVRWSVSEVVPRGIVVEGEVALWAH
jgi:hypothetical protein